MESQDAARRDPVGLALGEDGLDRLGDLVDRQAEAQGDRSRPTRRGRRVRASSRRRRASNSSRGQAGADLGAKGTAPLGRVHDAGDADGVDRARRPSDREHRAGPSRGPGSRRCPSTATPFSFALRSIRRAMRGVAQLGVGELLAGRDDVQPGLDRLLDLGQHRMQARAGAEDRDVAAASRAAVCRRRARPPKAVTVTPGKPPSRSDRSGFAGLVGSRVGGAEHLDAVAAGQGLADLDADRAETDEATRTLVDFMFGRRFYETPGSASGNRVGNAARSPNAHDHQDGERSDGQPVGGALAERRRKAVDDRPPREAARRSPRRAPTARAARRSGRPRPAERASATEASRPTRSRRKTKPMRMPPAQNPEGSARGRPRRDPRSSPRARPQRPARAPAVARAAGEVGADDGRNRESHEETDLAAGGKSQDGDGVQRHERDRRSESVLVEVGRDHEPRQPAMAPRVPEASRRARGDAGQRTRCRSRRAAGREDRGRRRRTGSENSRKRSAVGVKRRLPASGRNPEAALHERRDEKHARDRADVTERGPEAREPPALRRGRARRAWRCRAAGRAGRRRSRRRKRRAEEERPRRSERPRPASGESPRVAPTQTSVRPTTQGFRRRDASDTAPIQGASRSTTADERLVAIEYGHVARPALRHEPDREVQRHDVHREDRVGEVVERPAPAFLRRSGGEDADAPVGQTSKRLSVMRRAIAR